MPGETTHSALGRPARSAHVANNTCGAGEGCFVHRHRNSASRPSRAALHTAFGRLL